MLCREQKGTISVSVWEGKQYTFLLKSLEGRILLSSYPGSHLPLLVDLHNMAQVSKMQVLEQSALIPQKAWSHLGLQRFEEALLKSQSWSLPSPWEYVLGTPATDEKKNKTKTHDFENKPILKLFPHSPYSVLKSYQPRGKSQKHSSRNSTGPMRRTSWNTYMMT